MCIFFQSPTFHQLQSQHICFYKGVRDIGIVVVKSQIEKDNISVYKKNILNLGTDVQYIARGNTTMCWYGNLLLYLQFNFEVSVACTFYVFFVRILQEITKMYIKKRHWRLKLRCIQVKIKHLMGSKISQHGCLVVLIVHVH